MPKVRKPANRARNRSMTLKTTDDVRARLDASANVSGRSLTHEVESLVTKALDAETLEATLRRVVREEIGTAMRAIVCATDADITGIARATVEVAMEDAIAGMAEAQH